MNDDQVLHYLRERGRAPIPADLHYTIASVVADAPQRRALRFATFAPALIGVGGVAAALLLASLIGQSRDVGPTPIPSASASTADPSPSASAAPATSLVNPGDVMVMPALDADGEWGTVRLERGEELTPEDQRWSLYGGSTLIEIHVTFSADRATQSSISPSIWQIRIAGELARVTYLPEAARANPDRPVDERLPSRAMTSAGDVIEGWLALEVPADATGAVTLEYHPSSETADGWEVLIRDGTRPGAVDGDELREFGSRVTMPIQSTEGAAGTVRVTRLLDAGGFPLVIEPSSEAHFFVELFVSYDVTALPEGAAIGPDDWRVERADGAEVSTSTLTEVTGSQARAILHTALGSAEPPVNTPEGHLIFAVPRDLADEDLVLVYQPAGTTPARFPLRAPGDAPPPVAAAWPRAELVFEERPGLPITVLESAEADALFAETATCANTLDRFSVTYPSSWHTNDAVGPVPACSFFSPNPFTATADGTRPGGVPISVDALEGAVGFIWVDLYTEEIAIDGFAGRRSETGKTRDVDDPTDTLQYSYLLILDENLNGEGRKLMATTDSEWANGYELNRAVLDRIMASLRFDAPQE
ncbi:MAG: hypothetical protein K5924_09020 [Chloroflexi bacterium]|nr:hypothetical protein [Chloroflexota bacterium]